jgi:hypothetical protein
MADVDAYLQVQSVTIAAGQTAVTMPNNVVGFVAICTASSDNSLRTATGGTSWPLVQNVATPYIPCGAQCKSQTIYVAGTNTEKVVFLWIKGNARH